MAPDKKKRKSDVNMIFFLTFLFFNFTLWRLLKLPPILMVCHNVYSLIKIFLKILIYSYFLSKPPLCCAISGGGGGGAYILAIFS